MTCSGNGSTGIKTENWLFENWARTQRRLIPTTFNPATVMEIVAAVQETEGVQGQLKAIGSQWSYSGVAVDDSTTHVINTELLSKVLTTTLTPPTTSVIPFALKSDLKGSARYFSHVEAGIKLDVLNCKLDALGLAMPTLGGNNGQSIAGAISTGTHGSHVGMPPIADAVRAIHLVGPGGQEWWIEREGEKSITDPDAMKQVLQLGLLCPDIRIEYNTTLFRAVLVSMGRMGVVYSYVLEVVDAHNLIENRKVSTWTTEQTILRSATNPYLGNEFVEIILNPYPDASGERTCIVTTRNTASPTVPLSLDEPEKETEFTYMCKTPHTTQMLVGLNAGVPILIGAVTAAAIAALSTLNLIPVFGPILFAAASSAVIVAATAAYATLQAALITLLAESSEGNFGELLANVVNLLVGVGQQQFIPELFSAMAKDLRPMTRADGTSLHPFTGESYRLLTGQFKCPLPRRESTNCERQTDGMEFAFDMSAGKESLFQFIAGVMSQSDAFYAAKTPAAFVVSLRFSARTDALMGMQQFSRTCSVEINLLRGVASHTRFIEKLYELVESNEGIPHWGLMHNLTAEQVRKLYPGLSEWRQALQFIIEGGKGRAETFRSTFSTERGLEPTNIALPVLTSPRVPARAQVGVVSRSTDKLDIFVTDQNGVVFTAAWEPAFTDWWRGWWELNGGRAAPGVPVHGVSRSTDKLDVFVIGTDNRVYTAAWEPAFTDWWHGWWQLNGGIAAPGAHVTVVSRNTDKLDVFIVGTDGRVYTAAWEPGFPDGWHGWWPIGDIRVPQGAPIHAVSRSPDKLDIFVTDVNGVILTAAWEPGFTDGWHGWWELNGGRAAPGAAVTAVSRSADKLDVFVVGTDGRVYTAAWEPGFPDGWHGWWPIGK